MRAVASAGWPFRQEVVPQADVGGNVVGFEADPEFLFEDNRNPRRFAMAAAFGNSSRLWIAAGPLAGFGKLRKGVAGQLIFRVQPQGPLEFTPGVFHLPLLRQRDAQVKVGHRVPWLKPQRLLKLPARLGQLPGKGELFTQ
jgi:hypothetical protein